MIELQGVSYRYSGEARPSLADVSLRLDRGEIVGLVGPTGAGKSTLCRVVAGLAPVSIGGTLGGHVLIDGERSTTYRSWELAEHVGIGFADPDASRSGVTGSVFEEVAFGPVNLGLPATESVRRARAALVALGIEALARRHPGSLSSGEAQLVSIASLLAMGPPHLVLDEPTAHLDARGTSLVCASLRGLAASGTGILVAEQRLDVLDGLCDRLVALSDGRVVLDDGVGVAFEDPVLGEIGVELPSRVRLGRALAGRGLTIPEELLA